MNLIKAISKQHFDALTFAILPTAHLMIYEVEWFADAAEDFIATVVIDKTDQDWGYIILARNEKYIFNAIDSGSSYENLFYARQALKKKLKEYSTKDKKIHFQSNNAFNKQDIFKTLVAENKLHKHFIKIRDEERFSPAKRIIQEIALTFVDTDGFFFKRFQSNEFDQRLWELYLYAFLHEEHFEFDRNYSSPDYVCHKFNRPICLEATTVNPHEGTPDKRAYTDPSYEQNAEYAAIKIGRALIDKLNKKYWEKAHVQNKPLIIALQYYENLSDSTSVFNYVYGITHDWKKDSKGELVIVPKKIDVHAHLNRQIKSGFFDLDESRHISAVFFTNSATIGKFNRMGKLAGFGSDRISMFREGFCLDRDPNATKSLRFCVKVCPETYTERWSHGISILHNPNALNPLDPSLFPHAEHHYLKENQVVCSTNNHLVVFNSITIEIIDK